MQVLQMLLPAMAMYVQVIHKNLQELIQIFAKHFSHSLGKSTSGILHAKRHNCLIK